MKKIFLLTMLFFPLIACAKNIKINDALYYGCWVYKDKEVLKEYGFLANNPRKDADEYILNPLYELSAANEIYIKVKKIHLIYTIAMKAAMLTLMLWDGLMLNS